MTSEEIKTEINQNLDGVTDSDLKVTYIIGRRPSNRSVTSCVLEISPIVRKNLIKSGRIYFCYAACKFADHICILQCFRCLAFDHMAKDCRATPLCGHFW